MSALPILRVGLTGGIASGKSTVARELARAGCKVLDADALAHAAIAPGGDAVDDVLERFGPEAADDRGGIDRPALAAIVFRDPDARAALEAIVHPRVRAAVERAVRDDPPAGPEPIAVVDAALLVETGTYREYDALIVVACSLATQTARLVARDGLGLDEAGRRIAAQAPVEAKLAVADHVIDTDGALERTLERAREVAEALRSDWRRRFGAPTSP